MVSELFNELSTEEKQRHQRLHAVLIISASSQLHFWNSALAVRVLHDTDINSIRDRLGFFSLCLLPQMLSRQEVRPEF